MSKKRNSSYKETWPTIRKRKTKVKKSTYSYWVVDCGVVDGKRKTYTYKSKAEAEQKAEEKRIERNAIGADALRISDHQKKDAVQALQALNGQASLLDAVQTFLLHSPPTGEKRTVKEVFDEYLIAKEKSNRRPTTIRDARQKIQRFDAVHGKDFIHEVSVQNIEDWLESLKLTPVSRACYMRNLRAFFEYAVKREYIRSNPFSKIEKPHLDKKTPEVLSVKDIDRLFQVAEKKYSELIPYLALAFFAGLRPSEAQELTWDSIDFDERTIKIVPAVAKTRRQRFVDISDNLLQWLVAYRGQGKIYFSRVYFTALRKDAHVKWTSDVARHCFASYHLAHHENVQKTCLQMGHSLPDMLFNHYRGLVKRVEAAKFWSIKPQGESKVMQLSESAG